MDIYNTPKPGFSFGGSTTPVVRRLIQINVIVVVVNLLGMVAAPGFTNTVVSFFHLDPSKAVLGGQLWQFVTYAFLHAVNSPFHILMNMLILWMFGRDLESRMGGRQFLFVYLACAAVGGICYSVFELILNGDLAASCVGASGSVIGLLAIYAMYFPNRQVIFMVFPMKVKYMAMVLIGIDLWMAISSATGTGGTGVAHLAHLGGAAFGFLYVRYGSTMRRYSDAFGRQKQRRVKESEDDVRQKVDKLLQKIAEHGISTLSRKEKRFLNNASKRYQKPPHQKTPL